MLENEMATGGKAEASKPSKAPGTKSVTRAKPAAIGRSKETMQERIQRRAYELWESEGRPEGRQHAHWQQAEMEITRARTRALA